jgi:dCTP deaminase
MILTKQAIRERLGTDIIISPYSEKQLNPNSYNLRLGNKILTYSSGTVLDPKKKTDYSEYIIPDCGMLLVPNNLYLAQTAEYTETHNLVPMIEGRSSYGRLGLFIHITAGFGDVGFCGYWTLEMMVIHPLVIYPDTEICQIYYHTCLGDIEPYVSKKYQHNTGVQPSMSYKDFV